MKKKYLIFAILLSACSVMDNITVDKSTSSYTKYSQNSEFLQNVKVDKALMVADTITCDSIKVSDSLWISKNTKFGSGSNYAASGGVVNENDTFKIGDGEVKSFNWYNGDNAFYAALKSSYGYDGGVGSIYYYPSISSTYYQGANFAARNNLCYLNRESKNSQNHNSSFVGIEMTANDSITFPFMTFVNVNTNKYTSVKLSQNGLKYNATYYRPKYSELDSNCFIPKIYIDSLLANVGSGTVTSVSVTTANGISGTVTNPTTTPAITILPDSGKWATVYSLGDTAKKLVHIEGEEEILGIKTFAATPVFESEEIKMGVDGAGLSSSYGNLFVSDVDLNSGNPYPVTYFLDKSDTANLKIATYKQLKDTAEAIRNSIVYPDTASYAMLNTTNTFTQTQTAPKWKTTGGTSSQFVKGDGSLDASSYITLGSLSSTATGLTYTNTTGVFSLTSGYSIPTTTNQTNWSSAYTFTSGFGTNYPDLTAIEALSGVKMLPYTTSTNSWSGYYILDSIPTWKLTRFANVPSFSGNTGKVVTVNTAETGVSYNSVVTTTNIDTSQYWYTTKNVSLTATGTTQVSVIGSYSNFVPEKVKIIITSYTAGSGSINPVISLGNNSSSYNNMITSTTLNNPYLNKIYTLDPTDLMLTSMTTSPIYLNITTAGNYTTMTVMILISGVCI